MKRILWAFLLAVALSSPHADAARIGGAGGSSGLPTPGPNGECLTVVLGNWESDPCPSAGAPTNAGYWVDQANATLSAERNLGALTTGLVLNTVTAGVGVPSAYPGVTCTNQVLRMLGADGAGTCVTITSAYVDTSIMTGATGGVEASAGTVRGAIDGRDDTGTTDTILSTDRGKLVTWSDASPVAVTLPQATGDFGDKFYFIAKNIGAGTATIIPTTSTIDGTTSIALTTGQATIIISDGTNYKSTGIALLAEVDTLQTVFARGKEITGANSEANCFRFGDGDSPAGHWCAWADATDGGRIKFVPAGGGEADNTLWIPTNKTLIIKDQEGAANVLVGDPDSIGAGSGTLNMQTSYQFGASNLGIEFTESDTNPACAAGNYNIYADTSEAQFKKCVNGVSTVFNGPVIVRKTADETVNNSATMQNDDHLFFAIETSGFYVFDLFVIYDASAAADFKFDFTVPASATGYRRDSVSATYCTGGGTPQGVFQNNVTTEFNGMFGGGVGTLCGFQVTGLVVSGGTAGNVQLRWAQTTIDATDTKVRTNSFLRWQKL